MLLDEPFGALDPLTRDEIADDYRRIHTALGLTTVMVTHDMTEALLLADRIGVMREGRLRRHAAATAGCAGRQFRRHHDRHAPAAGGDRWPRRYARHEILSKPSHALPEYLSQHVLLSIAALALGWRRAAGTAARGPLLRGAVLGFAGLIQTIPALALLALFYPILLALSLLSERLFGSGFRALGFWPALLALTLYSMLPVLRNTVTALVGIDPAIRMAAKGVGMTPGQSLQLVELPLAAPVIMAGIRTAAVWVIGAATLSTPIGQTSLGNYIFTGLQTENWVFVLFGCVAAGAVALVADRLLALAEDGLAQRSRARLWLAGLGFAAALAASLLPGLAKPETSLVIGAKNFDEQYILSALIGQRLQHIGLASTVKADLGSAIAFHALAAGDVDLYVDYSGTIWGNQMRRGDLPGRAAMLAQMKDWMWRTHRITLLGTLGFENAYSFAMRRDRAEALHINTLEDLARVSRQLKMGGDFEIFTRPEWRAVTAAYGLGFAVQRQYQPDSLFIAP